MLQNTAVTVDDRPEEITNLDHFIFSHVNDLVQSVNVQSLKGKFLVDKQSRSGNRVLQKQINRLCNNINMFSELS